ncbi:methyl-accepting chemotaxis protein [Cellulomonas hominis]|uniref:methyl-accepting chemotaxis protein n=1 Tax=Cellulomonas hominis TaxID=156981 RepID=UPI001BA27B2E|nr:cache domain-containing protein [Cellulomonas hominis]VTR75474.1 Methyl-accepting chemotaxis protein CtpL [Cellulomonas hominis]
MPERVVRLAEEVGRVTGEKLHGIEQVARSTKMLALNALIESARAGDQGAGFAVVAREVSEVADRARLLSEELSSELGPRIEELTALGHQLVGRVRGQRLADLALNVIELMDRNLYERSCDVRWWATDAALVDALTTGDPAAARHAGDRLAVILRSYTVYLDLWLADASGRVVARAAADRGGAGVVGSDVSDRPWFRAAMGTRTGDDYAALDVARDPALGALTATYATAVREGGRADGRPVGALGVFFDWERQAQAIVDGVRLAPGEREATRVLILDRTGLVLAASDRSGVLSERVALRTGDRAAGSYTDEDATVGFAATPGYETYEGLGWYGALVQR